MLDVYVAGCSDSTITPSPRRVQTGFSGAHSAVLMTRLAAAGGKPCLFRVSWRLRVKKQPCTPGKRAGFEPVPP